MSNDLFQVELTGFQGFISGLEGSASICADVSQKMMKRMTLMAKAKAQEEAPVDTGLLRSSLTDSVEGAGLSTTGRVGTTVKYATFQELGTGIYGPNNAPIRPVNAQYLAFKTKDGLWIRAREVKGSRAKQYLQKGLAEVVGHLQDIKDFGAELLKQALLSRMGL